MSGKSPMAKCMYRSWTRKRVLILVKTYPNPSEKHREIVCTAGLDLHTNQLIRLYPIPFRMLASNKQFHKWQFIEIDVRKATHDDRRESYEVRDDSIEPGEVIGTEGDGWQRRWEYVKSLISASLEDVDRLPEDERPSLAIIKPSNASMEIRPHKNPHYTEKERRKLLGMVGHDTLFGDFSDYTTLLEKIPWKFRYKFRYGRDQERSYTAFFEDWEVGEAWRKWRNLYPDEFQLKAKLLERFIEIPNRKDNLFLALGTHSRFRNQWLAIGQFQPILNYKCTTSQLSFDFT